MSHFGRIVDIVDIVSNHFVVRQAWTVLCLRYLKYLLPKYLKEHGQKDGYYGSCQYESIPHHHHQGLSRNNRKKKRNEFSEWLNVH